MNFSQNSFIKNIFKILSFSLFFSLFLHADELPLSSQMKGMSTSASISLFEDRTKKIGIEDIKTQNFKADNIFRTHYGVSRSNWWIKFQVKNPTDKAIDWFLKFNYGEFDNLESWQFNDQGMLLAHHLKGDHDQNISKMPFSERTTFEFRTAAQESNTIYAKLSYVDAGLMEMYHALWSKDAFEKSEQFQLYLLVGLISALGVLLLYNFFIWLILKNREYFWYCIYLVGVVLSLLTFNQIGDHYLWSDSLYLVDMMPFVATSIIFISFILFTREFLETFTRLPKVDKFLKFLIIMNLFAVVLAILGERYFAVRMLQITYFSFAFFPVIGFILWSRGYKIARGYTIASFVLSVTIVISLLRLSGTVETTELLFWLNRFGFIAEGILISIALADRITILEYDHQTAQDEVRHTLEKAKETLEAEVKKRTQELEAETKKAAKLARIDEMTEIWNRRAFLERGEIFIYDAIRYYTVFSLVIIDIDHFKEINDSYGHEAGDLMLQAFTREIRTHIRDSDFFARIGGEEFVLLLPQTVADEALTLAKLLLKNIELLELPYKDSILKVTASMGIVDFTKQDDTIYSLLAKADKALYYVKEHGRNDVKVCSED